MNDELRERLAALEHEQWSAWMRWMFERMYQDDEGCWVMGAADAVRWRRQMTTPYEDLPEDEKESDRTEADRVLEVLHRTEKKSQVTQAGTWEYVALGRGHYRLKDDEGRMIGFFSRRPSGEWAVTMHAPFTPPGEGT